MPNLSPELQRRIAALDGCQGRWILDNRATDGDYSYALRSLGKSFASPDGTYVSANSAEDAARLCASFHWRGPVLLWQSTYLDDDCSWPGGYSAPSIYRSNARVFRDDHRKALAAGADGDGPGLSLDVRYVTDAMIEELHSLESYPLLSEDDHSELESDLQAEAWDDWAASDWIKAVAKALDQYAPDDADRYWAEEHLEDVSADKLQELFHACADSSNTYWQEEQGDQWIDLARVASAIDLDDLRDLTGLPLLDPSQAWRRESYPWPDGSTDPLVAALA
jgi:hypothetical protein